MAELIKNFPLRPTVKGEMYWHLQRSDEPVSVGSEAGG